jgi:hypothetical protein
VAAVDATLGGLTDPITLRFAAASNQVLVGDIFGTGTGYGMWVVGAANLNTPTGATAWATAARRSRSCRPRES